MSCVRNLWKKRNNLSFRLTRMYALLFAAMLILISFIVYFVSRWFLLDRREKDLLDSANNIAEIFHAELAEENSPPDAHVLWELNTSDSMALAVVSPDMAPLYQASNFHVVFSEIPDCQDKVVLYRQTDGLPLLAWETEILFNGHVLGNLVVLQLVDREDAFLDMLAWLLILLNIAGAFAALAVGWYTSRRMLNPLSAIIHRAHAIDEGTLHTRLEVPETDDELKHLTTTLNAMLDRVESAFIRQGQFTQDASHELRTPLSVLQGHANLLARWGKDDPAVRSKCIATIQKQTAYMEHLVENLLFLSRGDSGIQALQKKRFSMVDVMEEIIDERREFDRAHVYRLRVEETMLVADINLFHQLLLILLDNAAKYTPSGKTITLSAARRQAGVEICVQDEGCGVPQEQLSSIFVRFYRVDKARARETGGTGLGLAIAKTIVQMHGGSIWAQNASPCGLIVRILLPDDGAKA